MLVRKGTKTHPSFCFESLVNRVQPQMARTRTSMAQGRYDAAYLDLYPMADCHCLVHIHFVCGDGQSLDLEVVHVQAAHLGQHLYYHFHTAKAAWLVVDGHCNEQCGVGVPHDRQRARVQLLQPSDILGAVAVGKTHYCQGMRKTEE